MISLRTSRIKICQIEPSWYGHDFVIPSCTTQYEVNYSILVHCITLYRHCHTPHTNTIIGRYQYMVQYRDGKPQVWYQVEKADWVGKGPEQAQTKQNYLDHSNLKWFIPLRALIRGEKILWPCPLFSSKREWILWEKFRDKKRFANFEPKSKSNQT